MELVKVPIKEYLHTLTLLGSSKNLKFIERLLEKIRQFYRLHVTIDFMQTERSVNHGETRLLRGAWPNKIGNKR